MKKKEFIKRYGWTTYRKRLKQKQRWSEENPDKLKAYHDEANRKGGRHYEKKLQYEHTGLAGERGKIRRKHQYKWRKYKKIIAPDSQLHHQWQPGSADYDGVALVEKDQHMYGFIKVIEIMEGKITIFTEAALRAR